MDRSLFESVKPIFQTDYEFLKENFYFEDNLQKRSWFLDNFQGSRKKHMHNSWIKFIRDFETNVPFFTWFKEYAKGNLIDYTFSSSLSVTNKSTHTWTTLKGEKITSELPPTKSFVIEKRDPNKPIVASPLKLRIISNLFLQEIFNLW